MNRNKYTVVIFVFLVSAVLGWAIHMFLFHNSEVQILHEPSVPPPAAAGVVTQPASRAQSESQPAAQQQPDKKDKIPDGAYTVSRPSLLPGKFEYLFSVSSETEKVLEATRSQEGLSSPQFSPDGDRIVFTAGSEKNRDIWLIDTSGNNLVQITSGDSDEIDPSWMSDGEQIVYSSNETETYELWIMKTDGTGKKQITSDSEFDKFNPRCSPISWLNYHWCNKKGYTILYQAQKDYRSTIWLVGEDGSLPTLLTTQVGSGEKYRHPEWSPNGLTIVCTGEKDGQTAVCEGWDSVKWNGKIQSGFFHRLISEAGVCYPGFLPNGTKLTFCNPAKNKRAIWYASVNGTDVMELELPREINGSPDWSPDGSSIVFVTAIDGNDCLVIQEVDYPLKEVTNLWQYGYYSRKQMELLVKNRFVVIGKEHNLFHYLYEQYGRYWTGWFYAVPLFITVDSTLEMFHLFFDYTLRETEEEELVPLLGKLINGCLISIHDLKKQKDSVPEMKKDVTFLENFFAVAANLLSTSQEIQDTAQSVIVTRELSLIGNHSSSAVSPLFDRVMDYTQFTVRGHYTRNDKLSAYFRTMMWLGQAKFNADDHNETRRALILTHILRNNPGLLDAWRNIYMPMLLFVGGADDLSVSDYDRLMKEVYTDATVAELYDKDKLDRFIALAGKEKPPRIRPQAGMSFRFMPQRFTPDSYIHQNLVYDQIPPDVGTAVNPRLLPRGLDIMAVLGSERAYEILDQILEETRYENYDTQVAKLKKEFDVLNTEDWWQNIYYGWLYTLMGVLPEFGSDYPPFMQTTAWQDKSLSTALASWTELRHDTILYVKQSAAEAGEGGEGWAPVIPEPKGYVEPNPEFYQRLEKLITLTYNGLSEKNMLPPELERKSRKFLDIISRLKTIATKELNNEVLSKDNHTFIRNYGADLEYLSIFFYESLTSISEGEVSLIADVATDALNNRFLHEALGKVREMDVIVDIEGKKQLNKGGVFSYYEFPVDGKRLTDDDWKSMLKEGKTPALPVWTQSFIADK